VLEETALVSRPELREQDYQVRINAAETRKTLLRMLPGIELSAGGHYDSNSFLVNNSWADVGVKATWNLFNLMSGPAAHSAAKANEQVGELQRQAMSLAIMAQLYVARPTSTKRCVSIKPARNCATWTGKSFSSSETATRPTASANYS
jgi:outer membrane protein TolC